MRDSIDDRLMSSSSPEPENAAPADTVRTEQGQQSSRDGDQNQDKNGTRRHSLRSNSTSLLTQALAARNKAQATNLSDGGAFDAPEAAANSSRQSAPPSDNESNNGVSTAHITGVRTEQMAAVAPAPAGNLGGAANPENTSTPLTFNFHSMAQVSTALTQQQALLNGWRPRGMSLERTEKEKKVEGSPKGTHSTNPGDTALPPSPDEQSPITLNSDNPPTEGIRAIYRSWRDVRPGMASEKAWSIGEQGSDISHGQVERSITEAMTGAEHNNRSRKASHTLGFFKEGLPDDKPKKRESKSRGRSKDGSYRGKQRPGQEAPILELVDSQGSRVLQDRRSPTQSPLERSTPKSDSRRANHGLNPTTGLAAQEGYFDLSHSIETVSEEQKKSMPSQLLAEIRKHHNLTPGSAKGSSFSRSIPVTASERTTSDGEEGSQASKVADIDVEDGAHLAVVKSNDEDEESGEEQISSALFVPHHTSLEPSEGNDHGLEKVLRPRSTDERRDTASQRWLEEHKVLSSEVDNKYITQEAQPRPLLVPSPSHTKEQPESKKEVLSPVSETPKADHATTDDEGFTTAEEESGVAGTLSTTSAGSLKPGNQIQPDYSQHFHDHQIDAQQPLEAIELIPYRHQVGGHTTLWRFSKRAVAKQLSNRENEFYEKIERYHPQLLKFVPRCVHFPILARRPRS
jgi:inositol-hexakisphosphate kinase